MHRLPVTEKYALAVGSGRKQQHTTGHPQCSKVSHEDPSQGEMTQLCYYDCLKSM